MVSRTSTIDDRYGSGSMSGRSLVMVPPCVEDTEVAGSDRRERMVDDEMVDVIVCGMAKANWEGSHQRHMLCGLIATSVTDDVKVTINVTCYVDDCDVRYG